ncbi:MAG: Tad domain-containing protein [Dehalococcoidia bacterium]
MALVALMLVPLLGFVALAIDMGQLAINRRQLQNAVDAAALAAAQALPDDTVSATDAAYTWASRNGVPWAQLDSPIITTTATTNDTISVTARRNVPYSFARVLNLFSGNVTATATARIGSVEGGTGVMPFGLLDLNGTSPGFGYTFGQDVVLREAPGSTLGPGNYGFLALDGRGGDELRDTLERGGSETYYQVGDSVYTEPGQKTGPVTQGLQTWAESHGDSMGSSCDDYHASTTFANGKLSVSAKCRYRVVMIPIISHWPNGRHEVTIRGFASMYLAGWDASDGKRLDAVFLEESVSFPDSKFGPLNSWGTRIVRLRDDAAP